MASTTSRATSPGLPRSEFWTDRTVAWYSRAVAEGDYAARVIGVLEPILAECRSALDVGAGCGALALPLCRRLAAVTALEPTAAMTRALGAAAARTGLANLTVVESAWGETPIRPHDLVLCAHVGGLLRGDSFFLREVGPVARRWVALIRDAPAAPREDKFFFSELYPALLGRPYAPPLRRRGHTGRARAPRCAAGGDRDRLRVGQPFTDLEEACDFWMTYLELEGDGPRAYLRAFLRERLVRRGEEWIAPFRKTAAVIAWRATGEETLSPGGEGEGEGEDG